jgi:osmotically-inducible protein OsmY
MRRAHHEPNNTELQHRVLQKLNDELGDQAASIAVTECDGVVELAGEVNRDSDKSKAVHAAEKIEGVKAVTTALKINSLSEETPNDETIAREALGALRWYVWVPAELAKVEVSDGRITLTGEVEFRYQKLAAEEAVKSLAGVRGVTTLHRAFFSPTRTPVMSPILRSCSIPQSNAPAALIFWAGACSVNARPSAPMPHTRMSRSTGARSSGRSKTIAFTASLSRNFLRPSIKGKTVSL